MNTKTILIVFLLICYNNGEEPSCSKFDYDKNILEMLVRLEFEMKQRDEDYRVVKEELDQEISHRKMLQKELADQAAELSAHRAEDYRIMKEGLDHEISHRKRLQRELTDQTAEVRQTVQLLDALNQTVTTQGTAALAQNTKLDAEIARLSTPPTSYFFLNKAQSSLVNGRVILTESIITDENMYDNKTGVLMILNPGLYHVTFNFFAQHNGNPYCRLYLNNKEAVFSRGKGKYQTPGVGIYIQLKKRDKLDIRCGAWTSNHKDNLVFTGALIHREK